MKKVLCLIGLLSLVIHSNGECIGNECTIASQTSIPFKKALVYAVTMTNEGISHNMRELSRALVRKGIQVRIAGEWKQTIFEESYPGSPRNTTLFSMFFSTHLDSVNDNYFTLGGIAPTSWASTAQWAKNFVGYFVWEGSLPQPLVQLLLSPGNKMKEIWTSSEYCKSNFIKAFNAYSPNSRISVQVIPHGIEPNIWKPERTRPKWNPNKENDQPFVFLASGTWHNPRKGLDILVKAFNEEFQANEFVSLILKVSDVYNPGFDSENEIQKYLANENGNKNVTVISNVMKESELVKLMSNTADCFVSPHRSEGFGLFILQAMAVGTPVIVTGASGNVDFTKGRTLELTELNDYHYHGDPYGDADWIEPKMEQLRHYMREVFEGKYPYDTKIVSDYIRTYWNWDSAIEKLLKRLPYI